MEIIGNKIFDKRIQSWNILMEFTLKEYYDLSSNILDNNDFQRARVKSSKSVYSLLKTDLKVGCMMPPIVLALSSHISPTISNEELINVVLNQKNKLIILDGLQRSYTIRDLILELIKMDDPEKNNVFNNKIRIEIYLGINKLGILYRMLTLNTGQTPMSSRHQIEIIYSDYIDQSIDNVKLIREIDGSMPCKIGEYRFRDIIEGFTSFIERDYLTLDRSDILDNIKSLENLAIMDQRDDLFNNFIHSYHSLVIKMNKVADQWTFEGDSDISSKAYGNNVINIFNKSQTMTGFGSAIGKLIDFKDYNSLKEIIEKINGINSVDAGLNNLIVKLDKIRIVAKKIGNDQRMFFHFFFRELFNPKGDAFLNFNASVDEAYRQYERKTM